MAKPGINASTGRQAGARDQSLAPGTRARCSPGWLAPGYADLLPGPLYARFMGRGRKLGYPSDGRGCSQERLRKLKAGRPLLVVMIVFSITGSTTCLSPSVPGRPAPAGDAQGPGRYRLVDDRVVRWPRSA